MNTTIKSLLQSKKATYLIIAGLAAGLSLVLLLTFHYSQGYMVMRNSIAEILRIHWDTEQWQHCWLVVPAVIFLVWNDRDRLAKVPIEPSVWVGIGTLILSGFAYYVGYRVDNRYIGYFSIHVFVCGTVLWLLGWRMLRALLFPLAFLVFAWPLYFLEENLTVRLRMIMAGASAVVLDLIGIDVVRQGTGLVSAADPAMGLAQGERFSVDVADPCSGIRSLFALMMVSAIYAHLTLKSWWQKGLVFLASIPLAIAGNLVRILALTIGTLLFGAEFAIGKDALKEPSWFHMAAGYLVFAVALGGMVGAGWIVGKLPEWVAGLLARRDPVPSAAGKASAGPKDDLY